MLAVLAFCSCKESQIDSTPSAETPAEITHSVVIKFWEEEVYVQPNVIQPKVMIEVFDQLCATHIKEDTHYVEIELTHEIKQGKEVLEKSHCVIILSNHPLRGKPPKLHIWHEPGDDVFSDPVQSYESAKRIMREHCLKLFEEWWQNKDIEEKAD